MAEGGVDKGANPSDYFWERIPDGMPTKRIYAACGVHDNRLYVVGGSDGMGKGLNITEVLHIPTKKWQTLPNAPNKRIGCTGIVFFDNKMALIGGTGDKKDPIAEIDVLNLTTNQWEHMPPLPVGVVKPYVTIVGRNIYMFGGSTEGIKPLKRAACFNVDKYEWSPLPDMPTARYSLEGYLDGTKLYLVGGRSGKSACPALECFDIEAKTWESLPPFPHNKTFYGVVGHNKNIFVIGGIDPKKGIIRTVDRFSIKDKEWIKVPAVFSARADFASGVIGGRIVCVAGMGGGGGDQPKPLDDGETINNTYKKWQRIPNMMQGRSSVSYCLHDNKLYVVGGAGEGGPQGLVEILQVRRD